MNTRDTTKILFILGLFILVCIGLYVGFLKYHSGDSLAKFQIYSQQYEFLPDDEWIINQTTDTTEIREYINENVSVMLVKDIAPKEFLQTIKQSVGSSYVQSEHTVMIDGKNVEYGRSSFASGMVKHMYVFEKDNDVIVVDMFIPESESPDSIIHTFKFE